MLYAIGCITVILVGISFIAVNVVAAAAVDCDSKALNWWVVTSLFVQALSIIGLLIYFALKVI